MTTLRRSVFLFIILLYLLPTFIQFHYSEEKTIEGMYLGLPIMQSGDEPHYYILLYSLVNDRDIYLTNNYDHAIYENGSDAGTKDLLPYERHTRFFDTINRTIIAIPLKDGYRDTTYVTEVNSPIKEIQGHPFGLPFFAFLFLFPFRGTALLEHFAIYLTLFVSLFGVFSFYKLMVHYHKEEKKALFFTSIFALATPFWYYSKTFWVEPYLASFLIITWYLLVCERSYLAYFISGCLMGIGFWMKFPFLLVLLPFFIYLAYSYIISKEIRVQHVALFAFPLTIALIGMLSLNYYFTKNPFEFDKAGSLFFIFPLKSLFLWLFSPSFGLLFFSPVLIFAFTGIRNFWDKHKVHCISMGFIVLLYLLFWSSVNPETAYTGAGAYSGRYLIVLIPALALFCSFSSVERYPHFFYLLLLLAFFINALAAFAYPAFTNTSLILAFTKLLHFIGEGFS